MNQFYICAKIDFFLIGKNILTVSKAVNKKLEWGPP